MPQSRASHHLAHLVEEELLRGQGHGRPASLERDRFYERAAALAIPKALAELRRVKGANSVNPELVRSVRHLEGSGSLRHTTVRGMQAPEQWP